MQKQNRPGIVLIGMPGCGKSSFGERLARELEVDFFDADDVLEAFAGRTIPNLFRDSEEAFRDEEVRTSRYLAEKTDAVIACGGGVVERVESIMAYQQHAFIIFIDRDPEDIMQDVETDGRPLLASGRDQIIRLYNSRYKKYLSAAKYVVKNDATEDVVFQRLLDVVKEVWA